MPLHPGLRLTFAATLCALLIPAAYGQAHAPIPPDPAAIHDAEQQQSRRLAQEWLAAPDPRLRAWGAHYVLRDRLVDLGPLLLSFVAAYDPEISLGEPERNVMLAVLDALIQLRVPVPPDHAASLYPKFAAQSLILLSRSGEQTDPHLLRIFRAAEDDQAAWTAAGNLMVSRRVPGFAALLLTRMTVHAQIIVSDPFSSGGFGLGSCSSCGGSGGFPAKAGWPEIGVYSLSVKAQPDATLLAPGTDPVYYVRRVDASYAQFQGGHDCSFDLDQDLLRERYLAALLRTPSSNPPIKAWTDAHITWENEPSYVAQLDSFILSQQGIFAAAAHRLVQANLLTEQEAAQARPNLVISIWDDRQHAAPLPVVATADSSVSFLRQDH